MSNIHQFPDADAARQEASDWLARLHADDFSADDRARFEVWRSASPSNARAYDEMAETWQRFAAAGRTVRAVSFGTSMQRASRKRARRWPTFAAAAILAIVALGVGSWWQLQAPSTFETGVGEHASIALPDGSRLELNSNSRVAVDYTDASRIIRLQKGEAFFTVAHAPDRPFWVVADTTWVRAVGTAFNVYRRPEGVRVTVSEGRVKVGTVTVRSAPSDAILDQVPVSILDMGQQADSRTAGTSVRAIALPQISRETSWRSGTVYFDDRPLAEVVAEVGRYTPLQIEVGQKAQAIKIGGTFKTNPQGAEALLTMLEDGLDLRVQKDGQRVRVDSEN